MDDKFLMDDTSSKLSTSSSRDSPPSDDDTMQCLAEHQLPEECRCLMRSKKPTNGTELNVQARDISSTNTLAYITKGESEGALYAMLDRP